MPVGQGERDVFDPETPQELGIVDAGVGGRSGAQVDHRADSLSARGDIVGGSRLGAEDELVVDRTEMADWGMRDILA